jgi:hypothetical protein
MTTIKSKFFLLLFLAAVAYMAWVCVSPFPRPAALAGLSHQAIAAQLGQTTPEAHDKFVRWRRDRGPGSWTLDTDAPDTGDAGAKACAFRLRLSLWTPLGYVPVYTNEWNDLSCGA